MTALLFLLGCGLLPPESSDTGVPFPHADAYKEPTAHGAEALKYGEASCEGCHRQGATAPLCSSCHEAYPHYAGWLGGEDHGEHLTGEAGALLREPCMKCHGTDGLQAPSCTTCHASWPHPEGWKEAGNHGVYALARGGTASCANCHGAELQGDDDAPACTTCHAGYPHPTDWATAAKHGAVTDRTECWLCHGEGGTTGGTTGVTCRTCHSSYPHPADWATSHYATVSKLGEQVCSGCHEAGFAPFPMVASCGGSCHGVAP